MSNDQSFRFRSLALDVRRGASFDLYVARGAIDLDRYWCLRCVGNVLRNSFAATCEAEEVSGRRSGAGISG